MRRDGGVRQSTPLLTRRELESLELEPIHRARNWSKADVSSVQWPPHSGQRVIVKDIRNRPLWFRILAGRFLMRREWNALRALDDVVGVPKALARPDADAIVIEYVEGTPAQKIPGRQLAEAALQNVDDLVATLHARGVTHGDLHQKNILIRENSQNESGQKEDGQVAFIDWATAHVFGTRRSAAKEKIFAEWCALDRRAVAKLRCRHKPQSLSGEQREMLQRGTSHLYRTLKKASLMFAALRGRSHYHKLRGSKKFQGNKFERRLKKYPPVGENQ